MEKKNQLEDNVIHKRMNELMNTQMKLNNNTCKDNANNKTKNANKTILTWISTITVHKKHQISYQDLKKKKSNICTETAVGGRRRKQQNNMHNKKAQITLTIINMNISSSQVNVLYGLEKVSFKSSQTIKLIKLTISKSGLFSVEKYMIQNQTKPHKSTAEYN